MLPDKGKGVQEENHSNNFGSFENFRDEFYRAAAGCLGSGWAWLSLDDHDKLNICSTSNQDNPLMDIAGCSVKKLLLGLDVWEYVYYFECQNIWADSIKAFWNIVNWDEVASRFKGK